MKDFILNIQMKSQVMRRLTYRTEWEEILDIATNPSNFERIFNTGQVISIKELLQGQKRDKFCRQLAKMLHKNKDFRINHEGLLVKQIGILGNTYQVYVIPQGLVH